MDRRVLLTKAIAVGGLLTISDIRQALADTTSTPVAEGTGADMANTGYAPVNGLEMYYEIHGSGDPLLLIHGAYASIPMWGPILTELAKNHQVIAVESQGHGRTADIDRPIRYETMAQDMAALLDYLQIEQADVVGYSMGAGTALQMAMQRPEQVRKLVSISGGHRLDAMYPEVIAGIAQITPEVFAGSPMETGYKAAAPNPEDWPVLVEKLKDLDAQEFAWPDADVAAIPMPVLLVYGDSDVTRPEYAVELFKILGGGVPADMTGSLPRAQLAILPGTTHITLVMNHPERLVGMIEDFLSAES